MQLYEFLLAAEILPARFACKGGASRAQGPQKRLMTFSWNSACDIYSTQSIEQPGHE